MTPTGWWGITFYRWHWEPIELGAQIVVRRTGEVGSEVFAGLADGQVTAQ
jgi:hypothetical protein